VKFVRLMEGIIDQDISNKVQRNRVKEVAEEWQYSNNPSPNIFHVRVFNAC